MSQFDKFKDESLELNNLLKTSGGVKNDNSCGIHCSDPTGVTNDNPRGTDVRAEYANDDGTLGDTFIFPYL